MHVCMPAAAVVVVVVVARSIVFHQCLVYCIVEISLFFQRIRFVMVFIYQSYIMHAMHARIQVSYL